MRGKISTRGRVKALLAGLACMVATTVPATSASAAPLWDVQSSWGPTTLHPGEPARFVFEPRNLGDSASSGTVTLKDSFPLGVKVTDTEGVGWACSGIGTRTVTCLAGAAVQPRGLAVGALDKAGYMERLLVDVEVGAGMAPGEYENIVSVSGGGAAAPGSDSDTLVVGAEEAGFGMVPGSFAADVFDAPYLGSAAPGAPVRQAGAHPFEMRVDFDLNLKWGEGVSSPYTEPDELLRSVRSTLPVGLIGNPEATPKCAPEDFLTNPPANGGAAGNGTGCPASTQVGVLDVQAQNARQFFGPGLHTRVAVYNLIPPKGQVADLAFNVNGIVTGHIFPSLDPGRDYAIRSTVPYITSVAWARQARFTLWGVPADPAHDRLRFDPKGTSTAAFGAPSNAEVRPFLTLPMDCTGQGHFSQTVESWQQQGTEVGPELAPEGGLQVDGCDDLRFRFEPEMSLQPTTRDAGAPTGLDVHLEVPQRDDTVSNAEDLYHQNGDVLAIPTPPMKKVVVTFPEGMTISPSAAQGLGSCSSQQIGMGTDRPVTCPENSQYGTLTLHTPLLPRDEPMSGRIYIAKQNDNPFGNFLSLYLVVQDPSKGLLVKVPGRVDLDPRTGQITTTFDDLPQIPIEDTQMTFKGGVRAALVNPTTCGTKTITATFYSWQDPTAPHTVKSSYPVTKRPDGSPCVNHLAERPFAPELEAGTLNNNAGSYSPFTFRLIRTDDDQEFSQLGVTLPPGLLANISDLQECPEAALAQAAAPGRSAFAEQVSPSCPAASQLGTTNVGAGVGVPLTYVPGKAYLAGPYRGEPLSMAVITPLQVGPYDLGVISVRSAIHVDGARGQARIATDPFPQIYRGIPVRIRDIRVNADTPGTMINPTSCDPMAVGARVTGTGGDLESTADDTAVDLSTRFQAANCATLPFKPRLTFRLKGGTKRGQFPALQATLKGRPGDANIAKSTVVLPRSEFIEQGHIRTVCTRAQFAVNQCPAGSVYGSARARSPLFDEVLKGPVYLRANGGERVLPDLVVKLNGKVEVVLTGFIDSVGKEGRVRNTFDVTPDAPVTFFQLKMQGGKKGLLVNHLDLCEVTSRATVRLVGQNGKRHNTRPKMATSCKKGQKR